MKTIFVPLTKIDAEQRLVYGVAAVEELDKSGEIFDYAGSKPHFEKWSADFEKYTLPAVQAFGENAKSYGNVRAMHDPKLGAAGKLATPLGLDDLNKTIEVCAKVTDDKAWQQVQNGIYTGFSIGGDYEKIWDDAVVKVGEKYAKRYIAVPSEMSLVDNPCMPGATFQVIKAGGATELRKFATTEFTEEEIPAAVAKACDELATASGPAATTINKVAAHGFAARVIKRAKELNVDASGFAKAYVTSFGGDTGKTILQKMELKKGMYDVQDVASAMMNLNYCRMSLESCAEYNGDVTVIPERLGEVLRTLSSILIDLVAEETEKMVPKLEAAKAAATTIKKEIDTMKKFFETHKATIEKAAASSSDPELQKMATHLKEIGKHVDGIQKAHDAMGEHLDALNPKDDEDEDDGAGGDAEKAVKAVKSHLTKAYNPRFEAMENLQKETQTQMANLVTVVTKFVGAQPATSRLAIAPQDVTKAQDNGALAPVAIDPKDPEAAMKAMKAIHASGLQQIK